MVMVDDMATTIANNFPNSYFLATKRALLHLDAGNDDKPIERVVMLFPAGEAVADGGISTHDGREATGSRPSFFGRSRKELVPSVETSPPAGPHGFHDKYIT